MKRTYQLGNNLLMVSNPRHDVTLIGEYLKEILDTNLENALNPCCLQKFSS